MEEQRRAARRRLTAQAEREDEEHRTERQRGHEIGHAECPPEERRRRDRYEHARVEDDLLRRLPLPAHDRQHRYAGGFVIAADQQRERPEVRRCPEEDDREEQERRDCDVAGGRRPADQRRDRAGGAADDDVLGRRALQPARVDEDVEEVAGQREQCGEHVDEAREQYERERREREPELERPRRHDTLGCDGTAVGTTHVPVDVAVEHVVERARTAAGERQPGHGDGEQPRGREAAGADDHAAGPGEQQQAHDARLGQRQVVPPRRRGHRLAAERCSRRDERRGQGQRGERDVQGPPDHERGGDEESERGDGRPEQPPVRDPRRRDECRQRRDRERREGTVRRVQRQCARDDRKGGRRRGADSDQLQPGAWSNVRH